MSVAYNLKKARKMRGMTAKALGIAVGFSEKTADTRIAQYECNFRVPKADVLKTLGRVLAVSVDFLTSPILEEDELIMLTLLSLDSDNLVQITSRGEVVAIFEKESLGAYLTEWHEVKLNLAAGKITKQQYDDWKMNWSSSCGKEQICS